MSARTSVFRSLSVVGVLVVTGSLTPLTAASSCDNFGECECTPCGAAIDLAVFDLDGNALDEGWTVEATVDGLPADNLSECDQGFRFGNACSFGFTSGIYRITIRGPEFKTREIAARAAGKSGEDCCQCINATAVDAFLEPRDGDGDGGEGEPADPEAQ